VACGECTPAPAAVRSTGRLPPGLEAMAAKQACSARAVSQGRDVGRLSRRRCPRLALWTAAIVAGAGCIGVYFAWPNTSGKDVVYSIVGFASVAVVLLSVWRRRLGEPRAWCTIAVGTLCFVLGDSVYDVYQFVLHTSTPFPSIADAFYLAGYPILIVGVVRLTRTSDQGPGGRERLADAAIVTCGALALAWHFLMATYAHSPSMDAFGKFVTLAYPGMDLGVLFVLSRGLMAGHRKNTSLRYLWAAIVLMLIADFVYDLLTSQGRYTTGNPIDAGWLANYVLISVAVLHPSTADTTPGVLPTSDNADRRLPLIALAGFIAPALLVATAVLGSRTDLAEMATITIIVFALIVLRMRWMIGRIATQTTSLETALAVRTSLESELRHLAFHDSLTGLANRSLFHDRVDRALAAAARSRRTVAVCFCDLDRFKTINDSLGHQTGDALLVAIARRLAAAVRPGDTVARLGGDEFAILLEDIDDTKISMSVAERIVSVVREPIEVDGRRLTVSASVGLVIADVDATTDRLLRDADSAMYDAKAKGKDCFKVFEIAMHEKITERLELGNALAAALERNELRLEYQPQYRLDNGRLEGFEALLRWAHPDLGSVPPDRFIPIAEQTGLIVPIGRWVMERACEQAKRWSGIQPGLTMSVNLSGRQLQHPRLVDDIATAISIAGLAPETFMLEMTESVLIADSDRGLQALNDLSNLGVHLSVDDFGTGYSSLSYLQRLPVDELKIDQSFTASLLDPGTEGAAFVSMIIRLAKDLGLRTVAEGVETEGQRTILRRLGCDSAQGFHLGRPLNPDATTRLVSAQSHLQRTPRRRAPIHQS
jgi:diguanylate cyclase (GGDEF)-like protein